MLTCDLNVCDDRIEEDSSGGTNGGGGETAPNAPDSGDSTDPGFGCEDPDNVLCGTEGGGDGSDADPSAPSGGEEDPCDTISVDNAGECQPDPNRNTISKSEFQSITCKGKSINEINATKGNPASVHQLFGSYDSLKNKEGMDRINYYN